MGGMSQEFVTLVDDEGVEFEMELLGRVEYDCNNYLILSDKVEDCGDENTAEMYVFVVTNDDEDGESIEEVEDDELHGAVLASWESTLGCGCGECKCGGLECGGRECGCTHNDTCK